jgi:hypothetical protein
MKRKRVLVILAVPAFLLFFALAIWLSLQSAFVVNRAASLAAPVLGYRVKVEAVSFSPTLQVKISGLTITSINEKGPSLYCARAEVKGALKNVISAEVERLVLTGPKLFFRLDAAGEKSDLSALEKLPPVRLLLVEQGEVEISYGTMHVKLSGLLGDVRNFSPQTGGSARFEALVEANSQEEPAAGGRGTCKGKIDASGPLNNLKAKGSVDLFVESAFLGVASVKDLSLSSTFNLDTKRILLEPVTVKAGSVVMKGEGRDVNVGAYALDARLSYSFDSGRMALESVDGKAPGVSRFTGTFQGALKGDAPWKASFLAPSVDFTQAFSNLKPFLPEEYRAWSIQGLGALEVNGDGGPGGIWQADVKLTFHEGGFRSGDASKAGQRITGSVTLKLRSNPEDKKTRFDLAFDAGDGELLWGKYYRDFKGEQVKFASYGGYSPDVSPSLDGHGSLDLFGTGQYDFSGQVSTEEVLLKASGKHLSHQKLLSIFLQDYLRQSYPRLSNLEITGQSDFDIQVKVKEGGAFMEGVLRVDETALAVPDVLSVGGLRLSLPFDLTYPPAPYAAGSRERGEALLSIERLQRGGVVIADLEIPFVFSQNGLRLLRAIDVKLYGGELHVPRLEGRDFFSPEPVLTLAMSADYFDVALITEELLGDRIAGAINADFSGITYRRGRWVTKGQLRTDVFGGSVEVTNLFAENLFSESRKVGFDFFFRDIDLEEMTRKIALGKMTGIIKGSIANFVMEYGQPARFFLDVESDSTKKVSQVISVAAVENLSILGTGSSAISSVLNSGIHKFFKEYPYSKIGVLCTLENDTFSVRGKIREGGKEYLVRRGLLRGIDVIIQNPDNSISFGDMEERIGRIFRAKQEPKKVS